MTPERLAEIRAMASGVEFPAHWTRSSHPWVFNVRALVLGAIPELLDELEGRDLDDPSPEEQALADILWDSSGESVGWVEAFKYARAILAAGWVTPAELYSQQELAAFWEDKTIQATAEMEKLRRERDSWKARYESQRAEVRDAFEARDRAREELTKACGEGVHRGLAAMERSRDTWKARAEASPTSWGLTKEQAERMAEILGGSAEDMQVAARAAHVGMGTTWWFAAGLVVAGLLIMVAGVEAKGDLD